MKKINIDMKELELEDDFFLGSFAGFTQMIPTLLHDGARRAWSHGHVHVAG